MYNYKTLYKTEKEREKELKPRSSHLI